MVRFLKKQILKDLDEKMVFLAGPRQVGKTTLSKDLFKDFEYLNWDIDEGRSKILSKEFQPSKLWVFDEIHKYKNWRNYLKGLYDKVGKEQRILVTGSAKLDVLRKGGDSLQGRYHFLRLMPLSFMELNMSTREDVQLLYSLNGFPEPFLRGSKTDCNRWSRSYRERIVRQEVATNEQFQDLATIELVLHRLPEMTSGRLSINSLAEDVQVDHKTLSKWIQSLERLYAVFRLSPYGPPKIKAIKKEQKLYFFDWNAVVDEGPRFENFLAMHLLKWVYFEQDTKGRELELRYYRDKYDREVDFVVLENRKPILFIESKLSDADTSRGLKYLKSKFPLVRALQVHLNGKKEFTDGSGIEHRHVIELLKELV
jgi:predicted AAA+ superfamily ATPase